MFYHSEQWRLSKNIQLLNYPRCFCCWKKKNEVRSTSNSTVLLSLNGQMLLQRWVSRRNSAACLGCVMEKNQRYSGLFRCYLLHVFSPWVEGSSKALAICFYFHLPSKHEGQPSPKRETDSTSTDTLCGIQDPGEAGSKTSTKASMGSSGSSDSLPSMCRKEMKPEITASGAKSLPSTSTEYRQNSNTWTDLWWES